MEEQIFVQNIHAVVFFFVGGAAGSVRAFRNSRYESLGNFIGLLGSAGFIAFMGVTLYMFRDPAVFDRLNPGGGIAAFFGFFGKEIEGFILPNLGQFVKMVATKFGFKWPEDETKERDINE